MHAVRLNAMGDVRLESIEPARPGHGEVLLRIDACGICGTDRHIVRGEYPAGLPVTLGHEFAGTIVECGVGVEPAPGTRAAVDPNISCGRCRECRRGDVALCPHRVALGVDLDGGLAEYAIVPVSQIYPLPEGVPAEHGALCEPIACCLRGIDRAAIEPGASVVVLGGGVIGQLMVQLAKLAGATTIVLATGQGSRRALAEQFGATATIDPHEADTVTAIAGVGGVVPGGVDVVLECAGTIATFEQSVTLARRGGTVVVFGVAPQAEYARISPFDIFTRELRLVGSYLNPHTHGRAVELIATGALTLEPLITHRLAPADVPPILMAAPAAGEVKAMMIAP